MEQIEVIMHFAMQVQYNSTHINCLEGSSESHN